MGCASAKRKREGWNSSRRRAPTHPVWGGPGWKRFQSTAEDIWRIVRYIRANLAKARRPEQFWEFVTPYDGWLPAPSLREQQR